MTILCSQCGGPADRCDRCASAACTRLLCAELHEASCAAVATLPAPPIEGLSTRVVYKPSAKSRRARTPEADRALAERLVDRVSHHRQAGRAALLIGDLDT